MIRIMILANSPETTSLFRNRLKKHGIQFEEAPTVSTMRQLMQEVPFNGVILDVVATVRASPQEKAIIQEISELFPTLRLRWDSREQCFRGLAIGKSLDREDPVGDFLDKYCRSCPARTFREYKRVPLNFSALLSRDPDFSPDQTEKSVTLDISMGGCFLFSTREWDNFEVAWVRFLDFCEQDPFQVEIRHFTPWGKGKSLPGVGVKFLDLQPVQVSELYRHLDFK